MLLYSISGDLPGLLMDEASNELTKLWSYCLGTTGLLETIWLGH